MIPRRVNMSLARLPLEKVAVVVSLLLFVALSSPQLMLPGLNYDEAFDAVPAMQLLLGQPVETIRGSGLRLAGRTFPLMVMDYKGVVHTYWALPFLWSLGINVFALRSSCLFLGLLTMAVTYRFARQLWGAWVGATTLLLLAVNPSFIFWSRQGVLWTTAMLTCGMGALAAFADWWRGERSWWLGVGAFLLGLGLSAKVAFVWFPVALVLSALALMLTRRRPVRRRLLRFGEGAPLGLGWIGLVGAAIVPLLLGMSPLLLYNLQTAGTLSVILGNLRTSYYGVDNLDYLSNLAARWSHLRALLDGSNFWYLGGIQSDAVLPYAFWISVGVIMVQAAQAAFSQWGRERCASPGSDSVSSTGRHASPGDDDDVHGGQDRVGGPSPGHDTPGWAGGSRLFPLLMMGLMVLQSGATVSGLWPEHYLLLLPFPQIIVAIGLDLLRRFVRLKRATWLPVLAIAILMSTQLGTDLRYHGVLARLGGFSAHSDGVYRLVDYLERRAQPVVSMDWGIQAPVQFLTRGRIDPVERFGFESLTHPGDEFASLLAPYLADEDTLYVFHAPEETIYQGRQKALEVLLGEQGLILDEKRTVYDRSARPLFVVMAVEQE